MENWSNHVTMPWSFTPFTRNTVTGVLFFRMALRKTSWTFWDFSAVIGASSRCRVRERLVVIGRLSGLHVEPQSTQPTFVEFLGEMGQPGFSPPARQKAGNPRGINRFNPFK